MFPRKLAVGLPRDAAVPTQPAELARWQERKRALLRETVHAHDWDLAAAAVDAERIGPWSETGYWLRIGGLWTVPAVELAPEKPRGTAIVLADGGRVKAADEVTGLLKEGQRVLAVDLFSFGESKIRLHPDLYAIAVSSIGERPLGIEASQLAAVARWLHKKYGAPLRVVSVGPRSSLIATVAAALEAAPIDRAAIDELNLHSPLKSLKDVIDNNMKIDQAPELFCFGLLERFDLPQLYALVAPRPIRGESTPVSAGR
jgi:hypothetical protein